MCVLYREVVGIGVVMAFLERCLLLGVSFYTLYICRVYFRGGGQGGLLPPL